MINSKDIGRLRRDGKMVLDFRGKEIFPLSWLWTFEVENAEGY